MDYLTKPASGESVTVPICYTAVAHKTFNRSTEINIDILEQGLYAIDKTIVELSLQNFTISAGFVGIYNGCVNMTVTGNDVFDGSIRIAILFTAQNITVSQCSSNISVYGNNGWSRFPHLV